jgi:hypothetical protein
MATIRDLFVRVSADTSGVGRGLQQATRDITAFADRARQVTDRVRQLSDAGLRLKFNGQAITRAGAQAAQQLVAGLTNTFERRKAEIETLLSAGLINEQKAAAEGRKAAQAYTTGLTSGLRALTSAGVLTQQQGLGLINAAAIQRNQEQVVASSRRFQTRMSNISVGVVFALDAMMRGATAGESAWRRVLRSMSTLAVLAFDPPTGLIVAGILAATDVIVDAFQRQEKAIEKATRTFLTNSIEIARAGDVIRASQQQQAVFSGDPFARRGQGKNFLTGEDVPKDETQEAFRARHEGLQGLIAQQQQLNALVAQQGRLLSANQRADAETLSDFGNIQRFHAIRQALDPATAAFADLLTRQKEANALALVYARNFSVAEETTARTVQHTRELAEGMTLIWRDSKAPKDLAAEAERLLSVFEDLNKRHEATEPLARAVLNAYDKLAAQLDRLRAAGKGVMDPVIQSLLKAKDAFEKTPLVEMLRLGRIPAAPGVSQLASVGGGPLPGFTQIDKTGFAGQFPTPLQVPFGMDPSEFAHSVGAQTAEAIREALVNILASGRIQAATGFGGGALSVAPRGGPITQLDVMVQTIKDKFSQIGDTIGATLLASFGPIAILMRALEPAIRALTPLFDRLAVPIALVARVLVAQIEPVLRALWPIMRLLGIVSSVLGEVFSRVAAAIAQAVGGLVKAIGNLIAHIPGLGGIGHAIANFGQSILNFGTGAKEAADEFARTRKELQGMTWDQTAQALEDLQSSAQNASDALNNIPNGFRIQRAIFLASPAIDGPQHGTVAGGQSNYFAPGSIVINTQRQDGSVLLDELSRAARDKQMAVRGTTKDAADVIG